MNGFLLALIPSHFYYARSCFNRFLCIQTLRKVNRREARTPLLMGPRIADYSQSNACRRPISPPTTLAGGIKSEKLPK